MDISYKKRKMCSRKKKKEEESCNGYFRPTWWR